MTAAMDNICGEISAYFIDNIVPCLDRAARPIAREWAQAIHSRDESDLVAICLIIDLESGALSSGDISQIFEGMIAPPTPARLAFAEAHSKCPTPTKLRSRHTAANATAAPVTYCNVLDLTSFLQSYVIPSYPFLTLDDLEEAKVAFFGEDSSQHASLEEISETFEGPDGLVWVGEETEYSRIIEKEGTESASLLHDMLGLSTGHRGEMVCVHYPTDYMPTDCRQPTTLDVRWESGGGCYISAAEGDNWGRTHGRSGSYDPIKERIHGPISNLSEEFTARLLAEPRIVPRNLDRLRNVAAARFRRMSPRETES